MKESDLFLPVKKMLENDLFCEVHGEVLDFDVVGIGKGYNVIVEMKTSMSLQLLDQVTDRCGKADYIFVAVPKRKKPISRVAKRYLKSIKVGIIKVDLDIPFASIALWGGRQRTKYKLEDKVNDRTRNTIGGVTSSEMRTDYKDTLYKIKLYLKRYSRINKRKGGWVSIEDLLNSIETHYKNPKPSLVATLQEEWNKDWIETKVIDGVRHFRLKEGVEIEY